MDCERADLLVGLLGSAPSRGDDADDALTPAERAEAEAHVARCAACREALEAYRALAGALRTSPPSAEEAPSPEATARAYAAVVEAMGAASSAHGGGVRVLEGGRVARPPAEAARAWRRPGVWLQGLAAAACLLIVVSLAVRTDDQAGSDASVSRAPLGSPADASAGAAPERPAPASPPRSPAHMEAEAAKHAPPAGEAPAQEPPPASPAPGAGGGGAPADEHAASRRSTRSIEEERRAFESAPAADGSTEGQAGEFGRRARVAQEPADAEADAADAADDPAPPSTLTAPPAPPAPPSAGPAPAGRSMRTDGGDDELAAAAEERDDAPSAGMQADGVAGGASGEPAVVAAWRVGDQLLVLERTGDRVTAREGVLRSEPARGAVRGERDADVATAQRARVEVTPVSPSAVAPRSRADDLPREDAGALERQLRRILAAELTRPRDAAWRTRVAAALMALGERPARSASASALADHAARVLSGPGVAPSGR